MKVGSLPGGSRDVSLSLSNARGGPSMMIMQLPLSHQTKPLFLQAGLGGVTPWPVAGALSGIKNHLFTSSQDKSHRPTE